MPPETSKNRISKGKVGRSCSKHILNNIGPCLYTPEKILSIESLPKVFSSSINCAITLSQPDKSEKSVNHIFINNYEIDEMRFGGKIQNIQEPARNFNGGYNIRIFVEDFSGLIAATEFYNIGDNRYSVTRDKATYSLVFSDNQNQIPKSLKESYAHRFSIGDHVLIEGRTLTPTHWEDITENQDGDKTKPNTTSRENLFLYVNLTNIKKATKAELGQHAIDIIINYCLIRTPSNEKTKISELILTDLKSYKPENEQEQFENSEFEIEEEEKEERKEEEEEKEEIKEEEEEEEEEEDTKENVESDINKANYKGEKPFIGALHSAMADIFLDEFFKAVPRCEKYSINKKREINYFDEALLLYYILIMKIWGKSVFLKTKYTPNKLMHLVSPEITCNHAELICHYLRLDENDKYLVKQIFKFSCCENKAHNYLSKIAHSE